MKEIKEGKKNITVVKNYISDKQTYADVHVYMLWSVKALGLHVHDTSHLKIVIKYLCKH